MKSFKQFLKESKKIDEAKMDWGNVVNEVTNTGLLVDIIDKYGQPEIRVGNNSYDIKGMMNPGSLEAIRKKYGSTKLTDEQEEELKQDEAKFLKDIEKMESDIQKDMITITKKYEEDIKKVLKKYNAVI